MTSKRRAEQPFAGGNTQHKSIFFIKLLISAIFKFIYLFEYFDDFHSMLLSMLMYTGIFFNRKKTASKDIEHKCLDDLICGILLLVFDDFLTICLRQLLSFDGVCKVP